MTNLDVIENKISTIRQSLHVLQDYRQVRAADLKADLKIRGIVERYLYIATQATIDLAETIIAYKKLRKPRNYKEVFEILEESDLLPSPLARKLIDMVGFRNTLAHVYDNVNYEIVVDVLQNRLKDIEDFLKIAEKVS